MTLASSHGRYITNTPERTLVFVGEWPVTYETVKQRPFHFLKRRAVVSEVKPLPVSRSGYGGSS